MTEYEKLVEEGKMPPMKSLEWMLLQDWINDIVEKGVTVNSEEKEILSDLWIEIEHITKDDEVANKKMKEVLGKD
jgi:hypothetical protein